MLSLCLFFVFLIPLVKHFNMPVLEMCSINKHVVIITIIIMKSAHTSQCSVYSILKCLLLALVSFSSQDRLNLKSGSAEVSLCFYRRFPS